MTRKPDGLKILNFGELAGAPYSGATSGGHGGSGGSDSESDQVKSLMELQQQGMPRYGIYGSHYDNPNTGFPGQGRHPLSGGYPFPPMPGQNYSGYPHLGYPSSQSPNPREGKKHQIIVSKISCLVCVNNIKMCYFGGVLIILPSLHNTQKIFFAC